MHNEKIKINSEIAEILGAFIGDGWIESDKDALYIAGSITEDESYYDDFLALLSPNTSLLSFQGRLLIGEYMYSYL